jgi:predicted NAD/FAD-dependent oxidoreductase
MILKFNSGRGALCCEHCRVIIMEDFTDYDWEALCLLSDKNMEWLCKDCDPNGQRQQDEAFVNQVNEIAPKYIKQKQTQIKQKYKV